MIAYQHYESWSVKPNKAHAVFEGDPISGNPQTENHSHFSDEIEKNVKHCGSPAGSSGCQASDPGALCFLTSGRLNG